MSFFETNGQISLDDYNYFFPARIKDPNDLSHDIPYKAVCKLEHPVLKAVQVAVRVKCLEKSHSQTTIMVTWFNKKLEPVNNTSEHLNLDSGLLTEGSLFMRIDSQHTAVALQEGYLLDYFEGAMDFCNASQLLPHDAPK